VVKGTKRSAQTDMDGKYAIKTKIGEELIFSYVGLTDTTVKVGPSNVINVVLKLSTDGEKLNEVVVTGQGIKKEKKALGYAVTTIKSEEFASKPSTDVARALTGKAPGVNIQQTSGLSGSGTNIIIRGYSSITGSNQPLFVVDGIPFNAETNSDGNFVEGNTNASSRFLDLDPNSIESISILKGLSATTLYGSAGRSGVVLVTTKSGNTKDINKKMEISFSQSSYSTKISSLPDYQDKYGNGFDNNYIKAFSNWGPAFGTVGTQGINSDGTITNPFADTGLPDYQTTVPYKAYNNVKPFFKTGLVTTTSLGVSGRGKETSYNMTVGHTRDEGFIENNSYQRLNLSTGGTTNLSNGFTISTVMNYVRTDKVAPPTAAGFGSNSAAPSVFANILYTPRSIDLFGNPYETADNKSNYYRPDVPNPLWTLRNSADEEAVRRFFGNFTANYEINSWSNVNYRFAIDNYTQTKKYYINKGSGQPFYDDGYMRNSIKENTINDHTLSYNFDTKISKNSNFNIDGTLGVNSRLNATKYNLATFTTQFIYNFNESQNYLFYDNDINSSGSFKSSFNILGVYASTTLGYGKYLYLNLQGRKDYFSSLQKSNYSLFYPSASLSFVATDAFKFLKGNDKINFLKVRVGYGSSAGFPDPYNTVIPLNSQTKSFLTNTGTVVNTINQDRVLGNLNLKPELVNELEFGFEGKFFKNRVGIDLSLYNKVSTKLIISRPLDPSSGFDVTSDNVAQVSNKGVELGLNLAMLKSKGRGLDWNVTANYTNNKNIVDKLGLASGAVKSIRIAGFSNLGNFAIEGEPYGTILGSAILTDVNGNYVVGNDGNYLRSPDLKQIGDPNPKWKSTLINEFVFRSVTFGFQFEYQKGGSIYSTTAASLLSRGLTEDTDYDRSGTVVLPGVNQNGNINTTQIGYTQLGFNNSGFFINQQAVYDATNLRLREISLSYSLPKKYLDKTPFGKISMSIVGSNLWFKAFNFPTHLNFDPEVLSLGVGNGQGFDYLTGPSAKRYGFNFNLTF
jgi:TonB-linked SusC/RagA family outer membrane protein